MTALAASFLYTGQLKPWHGYTLLLAEVRQQALKLDKRAYEVRKELYAHTPPAEDTPLGGQ